MIPVPVWLLSARKIIGKITDFLEAGRKAGLWSAANSIGLKQYKDIK